MGYVCSFMVLAGIALFCSDRMALSRARRKGVGGAMAQAGPTLVALVAALLCPNNGGSGVLACPTPAGAGPQLTGPADRRPPTRP